MKLRAGVRLGVGTDNHNIAGVRFCDAALLTVIIPSPPAARRFDLRIEVKIPERLTAEERALYEKLRGLGYSRRWGQRE
jgi:hypothetical protein